MDKPSLTLLCTPSQKQTERCHPLEERPLNIREYARIQTFALRFNLPVIVRRIASICSTVKNPLCMA